MAVRRAAMIAGFVMKLRTDNEVSDFSIVGISVTRYTRRPLIIMADPVTMNGRQNPAASYMNAPRTGPRVRPRLKEASHQALMVAFLSGNLAIKMDRFEFQVAAAPTPSRNRMK